MTKLLLKLPWFVSAPAIAAIAAALAIGANLVLSDYFERSFLDEADPLASAAERATATPRAKESTVRPTVEAEDSAAPDQLPTTVPAPEPATPPEPVDGGNAAGVVAQGEWRDGAPGHNGEGIAKILRTEDGTLVLRVEEFSVTNGPDLFVVLSPSADGYAGGSLTLGGLKAPDGNFNYEIPAGTDLSRFQSAVVWCRSFDTTFAVATLEAV